MQVLFDANILILLLQPDSPPLLDPKGNKPLTLANLRVEYLISKLSKARTKIIIPTPALTELLVHADEAENAWIQKLQQSPFRIASFDTRAAIECASAFRQFGKRGSGKRNPRAKVSFDRQIISIAKVEKVSELYSDDEDIYRYANGTGIKVIRSHELELDPNDRQGALL